MLSMIVPSCCRGMICSNHGLRPDRTSRAVSSMRVPVCARTCSLNWPLSTDGKKSCPSHGYSNANGSDPERDDRRAGRLPDTPGTARALPWYQLRSRSKVMLERDLKSRERIAAGSRLLYAVMLVPLQQILRHGRARWFAKGSTTPASRRPPPPPAARTGTSPPR